MGLRSNDYKWSHHINTKNGKETYQGEPYEWKLLCVGVIGNAEL